MFSFITHNNIPHNYHYNIRKSIYIANLHTDKTNAQFKVASVMTIEGDYFKTSTLKKHHEENEKQAKHETREQMRRVMNTEEDANNEWDSL